MSARSMLRSMLTSRCDQGRATIRQMIRENSVEEMLLFAMKLAQGTCSGDDDESKTCTLAMHGLFQTRLEMLGEER